MEEIDLETSGLSINEYIDIDKLGLNDNDQDHDIPPVDTVSIRAHTAVTAVTDYPKVSLPTPLSNKSRHGLSALQFEYVDELPEYPRSDLLGYAYVISLKEIPKHEIRDRLQAIQYCYTRYGSEKLIYCPFLGCEVKKRTMHCTGVKVCQYIDQRIRNLHHFAADETLWKQLQSLRSGVFQEQEHIPHFQRKSIALWRAYRYTFSRGVACHPQLETCQPILRYHYEEVISHTRIPYIACSNYVSNAQTPGHYYSNLAGKMSNIDLVLLSELLQGRNTLAIEYESCEAIFQMNTKQQHCSTTHPNSDGEIQKMSCDVRFYTLIPEDLDAHPYALFISHGMHSHPPPPPNRPPQVILKGLIDLIRRLQRPGLTLTALLQSPALHDFCQGYNHQTLAQVHSSFANLDRVTALLIKQRVLDFPFGRQFDGVKYQFDRTEGFKDYTRRIFSDGVSGPMVICGYDAQIKVLAGLDHFEVDMSYKRVEGEMNEVIFAVFLERHKKIMTLLRVFMGRETEGAYKLMFHRVFSLVESITNQSARFYHLHGEGLKAVIADMDGRQIKGLGLFLQDHDPQHRSWDWQCENIMIFCQVHFKRTIQLMIPHYRGTPYPETRKLLEALPNCQTSVDFNRLLDRIQVLNDGQFKYWVKHKRHPVIAAGLCGACSRMDRGIHKSMRDSTNSAEQSHYKAYWTGVYRTLLAAINASAIRDQQDMDQYLIEEEFGINHTSRDRSQTKRLYNGLTHDRSRTKRLRADMDNIQFFMPPPSQPETMNHNDTVLYRASSSGFIRSRSSSRGRRSATAYSESPRGRSRVRSQIRSRSSSFSAQSSPSHNDAHLLLRRRASNNLWDQNQRYPLNDEDIGIPLDNRVARHAAETRRQEAEIRRQEAETRLMEAQARALELQNESLEREALEREQR